MSDICMKHIENYWKALTTSSNKLFNQGDFKKALEVYNEALYRAEVLNNHMEDCVRLNIPFTQVYIISCNNLANTYEELGRVEDTEKILRRVVYYLLHLTGKESLDRDEIQSELKRATLAYLRFAETTDREKTEQGKLFEALKEQLVEIGLNID